MVICRSGSETQKVVLPVSRRSIDGRGQIFRYRLQHVTTPEEIDQVYKWALATDPLFGRILHSNQGFPYLSHLKEADFETCGDRVDMTRRSASGESSRPSLIKRDVQSSDTNTWHLNGLSVVLSCTSRGLTTAVYTNYFYREGLHIPKTHADRKIIRGYVGLREN
ncbi:hypothetical protein TNCT_372031 [Trichonephila clavata]|uniref:Uncharacterized protein n=1 Tax=Trichonephila clavata TaxID=2740835 RepID=A0A8X6FWA3_TRICU|nr:hypothetical protein TNCT_372031 [Trichonephila clavata]